MAKIDNEKEIMALIKLIDDPDDNAYKEIKKNIFLYGTEIIPYLEAAWISNTDTEVQNRIQNLVHQIQFKNVESQLKQWKEQDGKDLIDGWLIITQYHYPELQDEEIKVELNRIRKDIWLELNNDLTALEQVKVFNHIFFDKYGFSGSTDHYHDPHNFYIKKVLDAKQGNPLSLGLVYMLVAQSLDMPVYGIKLPNHFFLAYYAKTSAIDDFTEKNDKALFYINAFSKGNVFSHRQAEWFLQQFNLNPRPEFFELCSNYDIILRILSSLESSYEKSNQPEKAKEIKSLYDVVIQG